MIREYITKMAEDLKEDRKIYMEQLSDWERQET